MAQLADLLSWTADGPDLKGYLGISDASEDDRLELWFSAAIEEADAFLARSDFSTVPAAIRLALYSAVKAAREAFRREIRIRQSHIGAVGAAFDEGGDSALLAIRTVIVESLRPWRSGSVAMV